MSTTTAHAQGQPNSSISLQNYQGVRRDDGNRLVGTIEGVLAGTKYKSRQAAHN